MFRPPRNRIHAVSACLIGGGALIWALAGMPLARDVSWRQPVNVMGINGSPYGEVMAMAMQGPVNLYFNTSWIRNYGRPASDGAAPAAASKTNPKVDLPSLNGFGSFLESLAKVSAIRTNPKPQSELLRQYLRRKAEDKLRFAYQLDPSHYANYNSLHLFITEPQIGTRPNLAPSSLFLADETIRYCLKKDDDPRAALTAGAACNNVLQLMFSRHRRDQSSFTTHQMRKYLEILDHSIARYVRLAQDWDRSGSWDLLSPQRIAECDERFDFIRKIRDAAETTIIRLEGLPKEPRAAN